MAQWEQSILGAKTIVTAQQRRTHFEIDSFTILGGYIRWWAHVSFLGGRFEAVRGSPKSTLHIRSMVVGGFNYAVVELWINKVSPICPACVCSFGALVPSNQPICAGTR
jgi:hypothetical protein